MVEHQCWSNAQNSRCETLEIFGIPTGTKNTDLGSKVFDAQTKFDVAIDPVNLEACHWLNFRNIDNEVILNLPRRKNPDNIRRSRKNLKGADLNSIKISDPMYINDSLFIYYKTIWSKCTKL